VATIVLADDDISCTEVMNVALTAEGHEVIEALTGKDAIEAVLEHQPDLVFLDVMMPVFDGFEACAMLRNDPDVSKNLPIVLLTSLEVDRKKMHEVGATDYLPKRHMITELRDLLVKYLGPKANPNP